MYRLAGVLHAIALATALCVQSLHSLLAGAWIPFYATGCAILLAEFKYEPKKNFLWWAALAWAVALTCSTFLIKPVLSGAAYYVLLLPLPTLLLCMHEKALRWYVLIFSAVVILYIIGVDGQLLFDVHYHGYEAGNTRTLHSWPVLDPNNAAAIISIAVISSLYGMMYVNTAWGWWLWPTGLAWYATGSRGGLLAIMVGVFLLLYPRVRPMLERKHLPILAMLAFIGGISISVIGLHLSPEFFQSVGFRTDLWITTWHMIGMEPWRGIGFGEFSTYYAHLRSEAYTAGYFAHNDPLQFVAEMGIPLGLVFWLIPIAVWRTTGKENYLAAVLFFVIVLQSFIEFQLYVPAISMLTGLILTYHHINQPKGKKKCLPT